MLRLLTCGSVDDGKSTLLGRLMFELDCLPEDFVARITAESRQRGDAGLDYSLAFDGLIDEKAQGITIDVAWRYVTLDGHSLVLADCPGHTQYTRNMVSAASQCSAGILLVDASRGITAQTRRHLYVCSLMRLRHLFVAVNKIDLVPDPAHVFDTLSAGIAALVAALPHAFESTAFAPTSGVHGINVVGLSEATAWFQGPSLYQWLRGRMEAPDPAPAGGFVFPVQRHNRPGAHWRGYDGTVASGEIRVGAAVLALPGRQASTVKAIHTMDGNLPAAAAGQAVSIALEDELDLARGDVLVAAAADGALPVTVSELVEAHLVWFAEAPASLAARYEFRLGTAGTAATLAKVLASVDMDTLAETPPAAFACNAIARVEVMLDQPVALAAYGQHRDLGGFLLVDRITHETVAAGMVIDPAPRQVFWHDASVDKAGRVQRLQQRPLTVWLTGLSGAGKSTIASAVELALHHKGYATYLLDGDNIRHGLCRDLGFSEPDRAENIRRVGEVARLMVDAGLIVLASFISPSRHEREAVRARFERAEFFEVHVSTPLDVCEQRDPKGLYKLARSGKLANLTGVSAPYEAPVAPDLVVDTSMHSPDECTRRLLAFILERQ